MGALVALAIRREPRPAAAEEADEPITTGA